MVCGVRNLLYSLDSRPIRGCSYSVLVWVFSMYNLAALCYFHVVYFWWILPWDAWFSEVNWTMSIQARQPVPGGFTVVIPDVNMNIFQHCIV